MGTVDLLISPGELIRGLELFVLILVVAQLRPQARDLTVAGIFMLLGLVFYLNYGGSDEFSQRLIWGTKFLYFVLLMALLRKIVNTAPEMAERVARLMLISTFLFLIIPIFMSYLGIFGYRSYGTGLDRMGFKGFMYAQNSATINVIAAMGLSLAFTRSVLIKFLFIAAALLVGTKAAAASGIAVGLLLIFNMVGPAATGSNTLKRALPVLVLTVLGLSSWRYFQALQISNWAYYVDQFSRNSGFMWTLTSGRWGYLEQIPLHVKSLSAPEWLLGTQAPIFSEVDLTALFARFGLLGVGWYVLFFSDQLKYAWRNSRLGHAQFVVAVTFLMLFVHSLLGGHVLGNAVVAYHVATILVLSEYYYKTRVTTGLVSAR